jgi:hypothetical protein
MYVPHQLAIAIQDDRLQSAQRHRLARAATREAHARAGRPRRSPRQGIVQAFRPRAAAAVSQ